MFKADNHRLVISFFIIGECSQQLEGFCATIFYKTICRILEELYLIDSLLSKIFPFYHTVRPLLGVSLW